ncbi:MAG: hypothetical protein HY360_23965 [Verrucomicrobia bacterium]|nr:hypothetical protein [Verrucomicrobiota bacterium]
MKTPRSNSLLIFTIAALIGATSLAVASWQSDANQASSNAPVFGNTPDLWWTTNSGQSSVVHDVTLDEPVFTASKDGLVLDSRATLAGSQELRARVRLRTDVSAAVTTIFQIGRTNSADPGLALNLSASKATETVVAQAFQQGKLLNDIAALSEKLDWGTPVVNAFAYNLRAYTAIQPGWPEDFRAHIEHDMAELPDHNGKWLDVRIELRPGLVRFWVDDRLVAQKTDPSIEAKGSARMALGGGAQLAGHRFAPLPDAQNGFLPIRLAGYSNARRFAGDAMVQRDSLPSPDVTVTVGNIPFVFPGVNPEGNDHLDIGRSLYRHANMEGYFPAYEQSWAGSAYRDPARIQLRIPNGQYDSIYLVAASDEDDAAIPLVTAMFYRPSAGFAECFEGAVPLATEKNAEALPLPVRLSNGRQANLWLVKIPLDPARLTSFADLDIVEVELTKKAYPFRAYPDPAIYGWHQGGRPSAVHIYAATLGVAPVGFEWMPDKFGHVWTTPAVPAYTASIINHTDTAQSGKLTVVTKSYDGAEETKQEKSVTLDKGATAKVPFSVPVKLNGYHDITATLEVMGGTTLGRVVGGRPWTEKRSFVRLAPDTRAARWTEGKGSLFGYWSYHSGHYTPKADHIVNLMTAAGARTSSTISPSTNNVAASAHWSRTLSSGSAWATPPKPWAKEDPYDPKEYAAYQKAVTDDIGKYWGATPEAYRPDHVPIFAEPNIGPRFTDGNYPEYWGEPGDEMTAEEKSRLRTYFNSAKAAAEAIRAKWPDYKILIPWGDPLFVVPLLRAGFPTNLIDGSGLDLCGFERLPEQQLHQVSLHRLYCLRKEYEKVGIRNPRLAYSEGIFVPTEVGACSWREQMDIYNRWALISMAYGVKQFYSGWFAFDCGDYYGAEHYGGCGIQRRIPYCDPKPAYAAFATMTDRLDQANFDGWLKTGSLTTYCLRFKGPKGNVYALWNIRGARPVTLMFSADTDLNVTDSMNNEVKIKSANKKAEITTDSSVKYVTGAGEVVSVEAGETDHSDSLPADGAVQVADLGDGSWKYASKRDLTYENNNFDTARYPGAFRSAIIADSAHGKVLASTLEPQPKVHELMPWYNTLVPRRPVKLNGAPAAIGLWVKGASDWGRVIYCLRDAKGERWISIGTKDQWNCDDMRSWCSFNFDGWRYLRFEMPGHTGFDNYRKHGTTWWRSEGGLPAEAPACAVFGAAGRSAQAGDGVVDLPLKLESLIVEQRSHILYVNDVQLVASDTVCFGRMNVEYDSPVDATKEAVRISRLRMPLPKGVADLPNPIMEMARNGVGAPPAITKLEPPLEHNDGTTVRVHFDEAPETKASFVWCSPHEDGRGAVNMTPTGAKSGVLIAGLRPAMEFYFWVVCQNAGGQMSQPSPVAKTVLVDQFKEK